MRPRDLAELPDQELLRLAQAGREGRAATEATSVLLERYQDRVYLWCYRSVRDHDRALDLAQETMIRAFRGLATFEGRSGFSSWLFAIARNRCLTAGRRVSPPWEAFDAGEELPDPAPGPDEILERRLEEEEVLELIREELDPLERDALWLRCYERLPVEEITRLLQIDAATGARSILQRARRKLRAAMARPRSGGEGGTGDA